MQIRKRYGSWAGITSLIRHLFFQESAALFGVESLVSLNSGWILAPPPPQLGAKVQWTAWTTAQGVLSTRTHSSFFCFFQTMMCHAQAGDIARLGTITTYYIFMGKECSVEHPPHTLGADHIAINFSGIFQVLCYDATSPLYPIDPVLWNSLSYSSAFPLSKLAFGIGTLTLITLHICKVQRTPWPWSTINQSIPEAALNYHSFIPSTILPRLYPSSQSVKNLDIVRKTDEWVQLAEIQYSWCFFGRSEG